MKDHRDKIERRRDDAVHGGSIVDPKIHPRRVWDLRSNRVLPFHVISRARVLKNRNHMPDNLWTVSHSWVDAREREGVMTPINRWQWPVPMPRATSLEHVRIELLNLGAEYAWLDALCLRQEGGADDSIRLEEWKLDVPTIGNVYQAQPKGRPCITYFNGLGLPFDASQTVLESDRHWFNRVWTVQETLESWLPGGLVPTPFPEGPRFFYRLQELVSSASSSVRGPDLLEAMRSRSCSSELDRIAGLAYLLGCKTLPLYDPSISLETAWMRLIKHLSPGPRRYIFLQYESDVPFAPWVSWAGFLAYPPLLPPPGRMRDAKNLELVDPLQIHTNEPGKYYQVTYATVPCYVISPPDDVFRSRGPHVIQLHFYDRTEPTTVPISTPGLHGCVVPNVQYRFLCIEGTWVDFWVVVEVVGERDVQDEKALEVIKWGVVCMDHDRSKEFTELGLGSSGTRVVYLASEEALSRSQHVDEYMEAFNKARESRRAGHMPDCRHHSHNHP
ncbi:uncharacterized protein PHACADRAFT_253596 [Phanerochaete carnosa HHB-10118-sp]|uniref:Heterokaryon incompatibility domain-containing protein n=1 Tax=Phanerochaete carnosa (strain HHB-10118-sp) TaxID=650164 RepID=K5VY06_PHACS|nr:uncharacterized protein PHACADRAFT_253596 [Phanerochaete carnosa HHB-10118-sp]EKM56453.1 hypothetical protein PHACADRAFT_253596 [Phanerochaete carnosa HHB-10118-sp]